MSVVPDVLLAPSILWLAILAATGLVFLPAVLLQPVLKTYLLNLFLGENIPTFHVRIVFFSHHFPKPSAVRLLFRELSLHCTVVSGFSPFALRELL